MNTFTILLTGRYRSLKWWSAFKVPLLEISSFIPRGGTQIMLFEKIDSIRCIHGNIYETWQPMTEYLGTPGLWHNLVILAWFPLLKAITLALIKITNCTVNCFYFIWNRSLYEHIKMVCFRFRSYTVKYGTTTNLKEDPF